MSTRVVEQLDDWTERSFSGGFRELHDLSESEFSGVVRAGGAELFMTRGTVVGIRRGSIDDLEEAAGTIYEAPTAALPLLAVMQERSDEVRAKYYTEETSIDEVDRTLEDGGFTGYVELSENVLSGDYYLVYHQGNSMSVAYVGNSGQLLTDDEAFDRTADEVGIYEVRPVDIEAVEIPEPAEPVEESDESAAATAEATTAAEVVEEANLTEQPDDAGTDTAVYEDEATPTETDDIEFDRSPESTTEKADVSSSETEIVTETDDAGEARAASDGATRSESATSETAREPTEEPTSESAATETSREESSDSTPEPSTESERESATESARGREREREGTATTAESEQRGESTAESSTTVESSRSENSTDHSAEQAATASEAGATVSTDERRSQQAAAESVEREPSESTSEQSRDGTAEDPLGDAGSEETTTSEAPTQLETRSIPSLDPELTSSPTTSSEQPRRDAPGRSSDSATQAAEQEKSTPTRETESETTTGGSTATESASPAAESGSTAAESGSAGEASTSASTSTSESGGAASERVGELQQLLDEREKEINRLESDLRSAESDRDSLRRKLDEVKAERDELESEAEQLTSELSRLEEELGAATDAQQRMTPQEALSGTDVFVRYQSKGNATLEKAHDSGAVKSDVTDNLRLEKHTQFESDVAAVGGRTFEEFIEETVAYRFVRWVVYDLLFEIQSTGHTESLTELYDALPKINRVELNGAVTTTYVEDGEEVQSTETFDIVFRERMGDPLLVADINASREGASQSMMEQLITAAERVGQTSDEFASAFLVTESFFEPEALETVAEATRSGILSRDKRKSFVNLSRKRGYHLCLVEARNQNFHLEVPEL